MVRFLPPEPDLTHLKNEAKALHKAHKQGDAEVCEILRHVHRFGDASDVQILAADVPLTELQFALARDYGFASWPDLRSTVLRYKPVQGYTPEAKGDAFVLPNVPAGGGGPDNLTAGLAMALSYMEAPVDNATVAGDVGRAFILQADSLHRPYGSDVPNLDIGWWPLDRWGVQLRIGFLSRAYGVGIRELPYDEAFNDDPASGYRECFETEVRRNLNAGRPVVAIAGDVFVVAGYDSGDPPVLGQLACVDEENVERLDKYPWCVFVLDEPGSEPPLYRQAADAEALRHARRLWLDEVDLSHLPGKSSGKRSWQLWESQAADADLCGPHYFHMNVLFHLFHQRKAAATYLRCMAARHSTDVAAALGQAADTYVALTERIKTNDVSEEGMKTRDGRKSLVALIDDCAALESTAQDLLQAALDAM